MAPSRLLQIMESHDLPANKVITIVEPEPEPLRDDGILSAPESDTEEPPIYVPPFEETIPNVNIPPIESNSNTPTNPVPEQPVYEPTTPSLVHLNIMVQTLWIRERVYFAFR